MYGVIFRRCVGSFVRPTFSSVWSHVTPASSCLTRYCGDLLAPRLEQQKRQCCSSSVVTAVNSSLPPLLRAAPDFSGTAVVNNEFRQLSLTDFRGRYLVLLFYPLDFTFVCPTELIAFSERMSDFDALNTAVLGVSTDSHFSHLAWLQMPRQQGGLGSLNFPLLADYNKKMSRNYGVLLENEGVALRGLFVLDKEGILRQMSVNDLPVGRSVDETLRLIQALQFHEKHGDVCPANWRPGEPTITPDPVNSRDYFNKLN